MDEYAFREKVVQELGEIRTAIAVLEVEVKALKEYKRDVKLAQFSAVVAVASALVTFALGRL